MNNGKTKIVITEELKCLFKRRFGIDFEMMEKGLLDANLMGIELKMKPSDLVYLFFDIENTFKITLSQEDIISGRFNTFNNIVDIIENHLPLAIQTF